MVAAGQTAASVRKKALVFIVPTGDEVRPVGTEPGPGEILDTNSLMLAEQAREASCDTSVLPIEPDDPDRIEAVVKAAADNGPSPALSGRPGRRRLCRATSGAPLVSG
jgi:putative molybdopterin biosynthesis protein